MNYASREERLFAKWLEELFRAGLIFEYYYEPFEILLTPEVTYRWNKKLKTKIKYFTSALLKPSKYTPDFVIIWNPIARGKLFKITANVGYDKDLYLHAAYWDDEINKHVIVKSNDVDAEQMFSELKDQIVSVVDIKPYFDFQNMNRVFTQNQKFIYDKFKLYVQKVVLYPRIGDLFSKTFAPIESLINKNGSPKKLKYKTQSIEEFLSKSSSTKGCEEKTEKS